MSKKIASPCVGICKYRLAGACVGCGMSKKQKKGFKRLDGKKKKLRFLARLLEQQEPLGVRERWIKLYRRKCAKKDMPCPLDRLM